MGNVAIIVPEFTKKRSSLKRAFHLNSTTILSIHLEALFELLPVMLIHIVFSNKINR